MSGISSSGLISGIDTRSLVEQLLSIEARPKVLAIGRMTTLQSEQSAFLGLNQALLSLKTSSSALYDDDVFKATTATSGNLSVLTATTSNSAQPGTYQFLVHQLVTNSQYMSTGYGDADTTGIGATEISFEFGHGNLHTETELGSLNGGDGVGRGKIRITDSSGTTEVIDLTTAVTLDDVLDAINSNEDLSVTASVDGDGLKIVDNAGGGGNLTVANEGTYNTAADLGIEGSSGSGTITGSNINYLSTETTLASLNDGNGVFVENSAGIGATSFVITTADGGSFDIVLGERDDGDDTENAVTTIQGVIDRIDEITGGDVTASLAADGVSISLTDNTAGGSTFEVTAGLLGNEQTARDLGIFTSGAGGVISGDRVVSAMNSVMLKRLNGGAGLSGDTKLNIFDRDGNAETFSIDENVSLSDVIDMINDSVILDVTASYNEVGNGIEITDSSGGSGNMIITGDAADDLGIFTDVAGVASNTVTGTNLQHQYVSRSTLLDDLNYGKGVNTGSFQITDATGAQSTVTIGSSEKTVEDVLDKINSRGLDINARINDNGDGIIIESTAGTSGVAVMKIESSSGTTAKDLGILGEGSEVADEDNFIDGSYERKVELESTDTLNDIIQKIADSNANVSATLINDGTGTKPYHLSFTSTISGMAGNMLVDVTGADLGLDSLTEAQDSIVFFGSSDPAKGILLRSSTNSLDDVIDGVNIDLLSTSTTAVELTIARDTETMVTGVNTFIDDFNSIITRIKDLGRYDAEKETRGVLLGNSTVSRIQSQLYRTIQSDAEGVDTQYTNLAQLGIYIGEGGMMQVDDERLREAINNDLEAVENLFAAHKLSSVQDDEIVEGVTTSSDSLKFDSLGIGGLIAELVENLTNSIDGTLTMVNSNYDSRIDIQQKRIEAFDVQLDAKRQLLESQFAAMEMALASLQNQSAALSGMVMI